MDIERCMPFDKNQIDMVSNQHFNILGNPIVSVEHNTNNGERLQSTLKYNEIKCKL